MHLTYLNKLAVLRVAVDLVKADGRIHGGEVGLLTSLRERFELSQDDLDRIHYITLQQAVSSLKELDPYSAEAVLGILSEVMCADNDIDYDENILFTSVCMSLDPQTRDWCNVISASGVMDETSLKQILYLESSPNAEVHRLFDNEYDKLLVTKSLNDLGLEFFYLPDVLHGEQKKMKLLDEAMRYLVPAGITRDTSGLSEVSADGFFYFLLSRYKIDLSSLSSSSFLLLKIRDSYSLDDDNNLSKGVDFFVVDMQENVKERIYSFISKFDKHSEEISYEGCYKILYDYMSTAIKKVNRIALDDRYEFCLMEQDMARISFESSPQARSFYLLLLRYGAAGVSQKLFEQALNYLGGIPDDGSFFMENFMSSLAEDGSEVTRLVYNALVIYSAVSSKEASGRKFLGYIESMFRNRSSLKNYINKGLADSGALADPERYCVAFDNESKSYRIAADLASFRVYSDLAREVGMLSASDLWRRLL